VYQCDFGGEFGQMQSFRDRRISTTYYGYRLVLKKGRIAGGAIRYPAT
jgi:hypothetical protein